MDDDSPGGEAAAPDPKSTVGMGTTLELALAGEGTPGTGSGDRGLFLRNSRSAAVELDEGGGDGLQASAEGRLGLLRDELVGIDVGSEKAGNCRVDVTVLDCMDSSCERSLWLSMRGDASCCNGDTWGRTTSGTCSVGDAFAICASLQSRQRPLRRPCSQIDDPPQSLQMFFRRLCTQIDAPPHSTQWRRSLLWTQTDVPTHSRHSFFRRPCSQIEEPLHCLQRRFKVLCSQIEAPPQSTHSRRRRPCSQMVSLFRLLCAQGMVGI
mmetsp:Transcript_39633/g.79456  ORF Transcript_39633/g.79456 Transcript_39633/m.79456 type:complete len:266 (+) Transcript_39633:189-986(+)